MTNSAVTQATTASTAEGGTTNSLAATATTTSTAAPVTTSYETPMEGTIETDYTAAKVTTTWTPMTKTLGICLTAVMAPILVTATPATTTEPARQLTGWFNR